MVSCSFLLGKDMGPSEGKELKTVFLEGRICSFSSVLWLCKDSGWDAWVRGLVQPLAEFQSLKHNSLSCCVSVYQEHAV